MSARASGASAEAVAAQDVKDDVEYGDDDLVGTGQGVLKAWPRWGVRTVAMTLTMIMMMLAIAETTALIAPPIAEKIAPCSAMSLIHAVQGVQRVRRTILIDKL